MENIIKIYSNPEDFTEGIFGQCLSWLLELLYYLEIKNLYNINDSNTKIIFDINTQNNKNLIPKFIQPKKKYTFDQVNINLTEISLFKFFNYTINNNKLLGINTESFEKANKIFNKYFEFNSYILDKVNKLNINDKTLGIHYRGTDKQRDQGESNYITKEEMILIIQDYMKNNIVSQIFCCSDEQSFLNQIIRLYPNKVIKYKQMRSINSEGRGLHKYGNNCNDIARDSLTNSSIIDMLALSKCNKIIKTSSALSAFSKIINPSTKLYTVSAMKKPWFPSVIAEKYETNSEEIKKILKRTMKNDYYNKF
jgi:hypothetical protein